MDSKVRIDTQFAIKIQNTPSEELHIYELSKLLAAVLRRTHAHPEVNSYISPKEIHTLFDPEKK